MPRKRKLKQTKSARQARARYRRKKRGGSKGGFLGPIMRKMLGIKTPKMF